MSRWGTIRGVIYGHHGSTVDMDLLVSHVIIPCFESNCVAFLYLFIYRSMSQKLLIHWGQLSCRLTLCGNSQSILRILVCYPKTRSLPLPSLALKTILYLLELPLVHLWGMLWLQMCLVCYYPSLHLISLLKVFL